MKPLKISACVGLASSSVGPGSPGATQFADVVFHAASATALVAISSPDNTLISVMLPNKPPFGFVSATVLANATLSVNPEAVQGGTPATCVTAVAVAPTTLPISMIST